MTHSFRKAGRPNPNGINTMKELGGEGREMYSEYIA